MVGTGRGMSVEVKVGSSGLLGQHADTMETMTSVIANRVVRVFISFSCDTLSPPGELETDICLRGPVGEKQARYDDNILRDGPNLWGNESGKSVPEKRECKEGRHGRYDS